MAQDNIFKMLQIRQRRKSKLNRESTDEYPVPCQQHLFKLFILYDFYTELSECY